MATDRAILPGALTSPGRRRRGSHDMLDRVARADTAVVARRPAAILDARLSECGLPVVPQEVGVQAGGDVRPGQHLVLGAVAIHVPVDREAVRGHRLVPPGDVEALGPLLECAAGPPDVLDDGT